MPDTDAPAPVPTVRSMKQWGVAKETRAGKITVTMTLADPAEAGAWAAWLLAHERAPDSPETGKTLRTRDEKKTGRIPRRPAKLYARAIARGQKVRAKGPSLSLIFASVTNCEK